MDDKISIHYSAAHPVNFILAIQEQAIKFTQAKPGDEYSYRVHNTPFMEFDRGVQQEPAILLEVGFQHVPTQKFAGNAASFHKSEMIKPLQEIIALAITPDFAAVVVHDTINALLNLGEVYAISVMPAHVIFAFDKTNVIFIQHQDIVK